MNFFYFLKMNKLILRVYLLFYYLNKNRSINYSSLPVLFIISLK